MYPDTGGPKGGSPDGYWSLAKIYQHGDTLEKNREYFTGIYPPQENDELDTTGVLKIEMDESGKTVIDIS